jgi:hypothetical protein
MPPLPACRPAKYGRHTADAGYNLVTLEDLSHCWARNLRLLDADSALLLKRADFVTLSGGWVRCGVCARMLDGAPAALATAAAPLLSSLLLLEDTRSDHHQAPVLHSAQPAEPAEPAVPSRLLLLLLLQTSQ